MRWAAENPVTIFGIDESVSIYPKHP